MLWCLSRVNHTGSVSAWDVFDFDSYFRRADEPMTDDMPRPMGIDEEDFDEDEEEEE